jgi:hypothetical protein
VKYNIAAGVQTKDIEGYHRSNRTQYKYLKSDTLENIDNVFSKEAFPLIKQGYYTHPNTGNQQHREYLLTKMQTFDLMTGYSTELRIKVNRRWEELESKRQLDFSDPDTVLMLVQN